MLFGFGKFVFINEQDIPEEINYFSSVTIGEFEVKTTKISCAVIKQYCLNSLLLSGYSPRPSASESFVELLSRSIFPAPSLVSPVIDACISSTTQKETGSENWIMNSLPLGLGTIFFLSPIYNSVTLATSSFPS